MDRSFEQQAGRQAPSYTMLQMVNIMDVDSVEIIEGLPYFL